MSTVFATYARIIHRKGRTVVLTRQRSTPRDEQVTFTAASRDFRTNHPEMLVGNLHQDRQEYWCKFDDFDGINPPEEMDWLDDGTRQYLVEEVSPLYDGLRVAGYRLVCMGQNDG